MSVSLTPGQSVVHHAQVAEGLGYRTVWVADSPVIFPDVWMVLTQLATATETIGLGPAVVPSLRHVAVTATALKTLHTLAPGRVQIVVGAGDIERRLLGQQPLDEGALERYVAQLRALFRDELVSIEGAYTRLLHSPAVLEPTLGEVPVLVAATTAAERALAARHGDGLFCSGMPTAGFDRCTVMVTGTVLDDDESYGSERVLRDAAPAVARAYHAMYETRDGSASVASSPHGADWLAHIENQPEDQRHLTVHAGHLSTAAGPDALLTDAATVAQFTFTGTVDELRQRVEALEAAGATEIAFHPVGADVERELRAFAEVMAPWRDIGSNVRADAKEGAK